MSTGRSEGSDGRVDGIVEPVVRVQEQLKVVRDPSGRTRERKTLCLIITVTRNLEASDRIKNTELQDSWLLRIDRGFNLLNLVKYDLFIGKRVDGYSRIHVQLVPSDRYTAC